MKLLEIKKYKSANIVITPHCPDLSPNEDLWCGSWKINPYGEITIFLETKFVRACVNKNLEKEIYHTLEHEYLEAKKAVKLAREKYPKLNPYLMAERDGSIGGDAHLYIVRTYEKMSEPKYMRYLDKLYQKLGLV